MKRVLFISGSLPPIKCGVGYYTYRLVQEMAGAELKIDVSLLSTDGVSADLPTPLLTVPAWRIINLPKIINTVKKNQSEIIHIQYPAVGYKRQLGINLLPYCLKLLLPRRKLVVTLHEYHGSRWLGRARDFITSMPANRIIVSNNADLWSLPKILRRKSQVIPIGSNLERSAPNPAVYKKIMAQQKLDPAKKTLLFFGFAYPNKGLDVLLEAMTDQRLDEHQLLLLSELKEDDAYQARLLKKVGEINKTKIRVGITGFLPDRQVSEVMRELRYFVLPQPLPITAKSSTAIAAVSHGLILVSKAADNPGQTEPFKHLQNSYLLKAMNPDSIAGAIAELEDSPELAGKLKAGAKNLTEYFAWPSIVKKHLELYGEL